MFPHFFCIGAQKSGTTWLYHNLKDHPQIWLPPVKEIRYFNFADRRPWLISLLSDQRGRAILYKRVKNAWPYLKKGQYIQWYLRYFLLPRHDGWYAALFSPKATQIAGDITPAYATVNEHIVTHIYSLKPELKIIYLLRNPMTRVWSHGAMKFWNWGDGIDAIDEETIKNFLDERETIRRSRYIETLRIWKQVYPKEQIFIGFFEQLKDNPSQLLKEICDFLEVDASYIPLSVEQRVKAGHYTSIPARWASYLAEQHHEEIKRLHERFNNNSTASWLAFAEAHLNSERFYL